MVLMAPTGDFPAQSAIVVFAKSEQEPKPPQTDEDQELLKICALKIVPNPPESEWHTKLVCSALGLGGVGVCPKINWIADIHSGKYFIIICLFNRCGIKRSWWWSYGIARAATPPSHPHHHQSEQRINILNPPMCNLIIQSLCICKLQHKCSVICIRISTEDLLLPILIDREVHKEELINNWWIVGVYKERLIFCFVLQV